MAQEHNHQHSHESRVVRHWPIMALGVVVAAIFIVVLVTFQVDETDYAAVYTFGSPEMAETESGERQVKVYDAGLHLKWPYPVDRVRRHDKRLQSYELERGQYEQIQTADDYEVIVKTYVLWKVGRPGLFFKAVETTEEAEDDIDDLVRNSRNLTVSQYKLSELINTEQEKLKIEKIEEEILADVQDVALNEYGIEIRDIGFKHVGFPKKVSKAVFARMRAERQRMSEQYIAQGESEARQIRAKADLEAKNIIAKAETKATDIRAEADKKAAESYEVFKKHPQLAQFLRKLDALRKTLKRRTTLVVNTQTPPYDLLEPGATDLAERLPDLPAETESGEDGSDKENKSAQNQDANAEESAK